MRRTTRRGATDDRRSKRGQGVPRMISRAWLSTPGGARLFRPPSRACGGNPKPQAAVRPRRLRRRPAARQRPAPADPVAALIATSQKHFLAGERELELGHLERPAVEFDRAVDVLLESPYGARTEPRPPRALRPPGRPHQRLRGHRRSPRATASPRRKTEPASIDELLAIATFPKPAATRRPTKAVKADLADHARRPDSAERPRARLRRAVPGPAARLHPGRA